MLPARPQSRTCVGTGSAASRCPPSPGGSSPGQGPAGTGRIPSLCAGYPPAGEATWPTRWGCWSHPARTPQNHPLDSKPGGLLSSELRDGNGLREAKRPAQGHTGGMGHDRRWTRPAVPDKGHLRRGVGRSPAGAENRKAAPSLRPSRAGAGRGGSAARGGRPPAPPPRPPPPAPRRAGLTLSRSNGCVQQAAPQEASPPKYQRDTRASAAMARAADARERRRLARGSCCPQPGPGLRPAAPGPRLPPRTPARTAARAEFKAPPATRAPRSQCARAAQGAGPARPRLEPGAGRTARVLKRPRPGSGVDWVPRSCRPPYPRGGGVAGPPPLHQLLGVCWVGPLHCPREPGDPRPPPPLQGHPHA